MTTKTTKKAISKIQRIQLNLLRESSFNDLDGNKVADDLMLYRDLWIAFLIDREAYSAEGERRRQRESLTRVGKLEGLPVAPIDTIRLRDLAAGYWNVDALFILPVPGKEDKLELLANSWNADEIDWYDPLDARYAGGFPPGAPIEKMLRVWWD